MNRRRWLVLSLVFFGIVISYIDRGNLSIAAPAIMRDFHIEPATMGVLLSSFFWTYAAFQIPAGLLVDRLGIRRAYAGGFLIWSLASASIALSRGTGDVVAMRLVLGLAESIGPLASMSFIRNNFAGKDQGLPTSIYIAGQNIGPALGALVGTVLLDQFGWRMMFAVTGLGALIWMPCWLFGRASRRYPSRTSTPERSADASWRYLGALTWLTPWPSRCFWAMSPLHSAVVLLLVFCPDLGADVSARLSRVLNGRHGAPGLHFPVHHGCHEYCRGPGGRQIGGAGGSVPYPRPVCRGGIYGHGCRSAPSGADGSLLDPSGPHVFNVRHGHRQFQLLGDLSTCATKEHGGANDRLSEHDLPDCRCRGACYYGMDTRAAKALRTCNCRRRCVSCSRCLVPACDRPPGTGADESTSGGGSCRRRLTGG